ncbi:MAG TPA: hypothetical protein VFL34_17430 [Candidatus Sulfotelmatobacter sp.]|nr:hypothetical protein [Candidatus Sulfotelmatobacter sp.]
MKNPHAHVPFCQTSSSIAASCPACQWSPVQLSLPAPASAFEKKLTQEDQKFLKELLVSY